MLKDLNSATAHHPAAAEAWRVVSDIFQPTSWRVLAGAVAIVATVRRRFRTAIIIVIAAGGAALLSAVVKSAVSRPRPVPPIAIDHASGWSFPSGHALAAAAVATVLAATVPWPRGRNRIVAVAVAAISVLAVATSRLALGVHYLTDVIGGLALGGCWSSLTVVVGRSFGSAERAQPDGGDTGGDAVCTDGSR